MKYVGEKTITDTALKLIAVIEGYDIYVPQYYCNQISFIKKGCLLWINHLGNDCIIFEIEEGEKWKDEIRYYIQKKLPIIKDPICRYISKMDEIIEDEDRTLLITEFSGRLFDRDGTILSEIIAKRECLPNNIIEELEEDEQGILPQIKIIVKKCLCKSSLIDLMNWILSQKCVRKYYEEKLWYEPSENENYSSELGFSFTNNVVYTRNISI